MVSRENVVIDPAQRSRTSNPLIFIDHKKLSEDGLVLTPSLCMDEGEISPFGVLRAKSRRTYKRREHQWGIQREGNEN